MFRVSYLDESNNLAHKKFNNTKEAYKWVKDHDKIAPLKLLVWDENINCYSTLYDFRG